MGHSGDRPVSHAYTGVDRRGALARISSFLAGGAVWPLLSGARRSTREQPETPVPPTGRMRRIATEEAFTIPEVSAGRFSKPRRRWTRHSTFIHARRPTAWPVRSEIIDWKVRFGATAWRLGRPQSVSCSAECSIVFPSCVSGSCGRPRRASSDASIRWVLARRPGASVV